MGETLAKSVCAMPEPFFGVDQRRAKLHEISSTKVFEFAALEQIPHSFLWIHLWRRGRQPLQMKACGSPCAQEIFDDARAVDRRAVPDDQQLALNFAQKHLQETHDIRACIRVILNLQEQSAIRRQPTYGRQVVTGQRDGQDGGLSHRRIGSHSHRQEIERRLVYEHDGTGFLFRLFFSSITRCSRQVWMAWASRWLARLPGFWTLCLMALRRRLQWVG